MESLTVLAWATTGAILGLATGLVPGLHVNTLAAIGLAVVPTGGAPMALVLAAAGVTHTFVSILPATYLGTPGEDTALSVLPAHRLLHEGRAPEAVHLSVHASLLGLLGGLTLWLPLRWALLEPGRLIGHIDRATPWLLGAALVALVVQEAGRSARRMLAALAIMVLSAWLGLLAFEWPVRALASVPATPLLPLLAGLFGVPGLVVSLQDGVPIPPQTRMPSWSASASLRKRDILPGVLVSACTAVLPGLTSAVATSLARVGRRTQDPRPVLATLSTVNTAHAVLALGLLWLVGRTRSGLAQAVDALAPTTMWTTGSLPPLFGAMAQAVLMAGVVGAAGTLWLERPFRAGIGRLPDRAPPLLGLCLIVGLVLVLTGGNGLLLLTVSAFVGTLPLVIGTRRVHLIAALLVPILVRVSR